MLKGNFDADQNSQDMNQLSSLINQEAVTPKDGFKAPLLQVSKTNKLPKKSFKEPMNLVTSESRRKSEYKSRREKIIKKKEKVLKELASVYGLSTDKVHITQFEK